MKDTKFSNSRARNFMYSAPGVTTSSCAINKYVKVVKTRLEGVLRWLSNAQIQKEQKEDKGRDNGVNVER